MPNFKKVKAGLGEGLLSDLSKQLALNEFQITYIPIEDIVLNKKNEGFSMDEIDELKTSISEVGLEQNLVVLRSENKYKLLSGHRRYIACCELVTEGVDKYKSLPCIIKDLDKIDLPLDDDTKELYTLITTNAELRKNTDADRLKMINDLYVVYDKLKENGYVKLGKRRNFIAERIGVSPTTVQTLTYVDAHLSDEYRQAFENSEISLTVADKIAHLNSAEQKMLKNEISNLNEMSVDAVDNFTNNKSKNVETKKSDAFISESFTVDKTDFVKIFERVNELKCLNIDSDIVLNKKEYDIFIAAKKGIEKHIKKIEDTIKSNV